MAKSQQEKRKINYEEFDLKKIKLKDYGVDFSWLVKGESGKHFREYMAKQHEDLDKALEALKPYFAKRLGLDSVTEKIRTEMESKELIKKEEILKIQINEIERCNVSGITLAGDNSLRRIIIIGSVKVPIYGMFSLGAPGIYFEGERLGYENAIEDLCEEVRKEAYNMLFLGKVAPVEEQEELFNEDYLEK